MRGVLALRVRLPAEGDLHRRRASSRPGNPVERGPEVFDINMLRCIFCGLCEEACPEEAIFMSKEFALWGRPAAT